MLEDVSLEQRRRFEEGKLERCVCSTTAEQVTSRDHQIHRNNFACFPVKHLSDVLEKSVKGLAQFERKEIPTGQ